MIDMSSVDAGEHVQVRQTTQSSGYVADDAIHPGLQCSPSRAVSLPGKRPAAIAGHDPRRPTMPGQSSPTTAEQSAPTINRRPWNRGRLIGQKPPLKMREVWAIRTRLQLANRLRDLALFNVAIDSKLRGCDIVALRVDDVELSGRVRPRTTVLQKKTGRPVQFEIMEQTRSAVQDWISRADRKPGDYLFPSRVKKDKPLGTRHYARLVDGWVSSIGLDPALYGTHSLRRTKVALIYRRTGNLRAVQLLLGHTKLESTVRYLGIEVDDALALAEQTDI
jgi:integrase